MERIMLSLMFRREAEEAVKSYESLFSPIFGDSKILAITIMTRMNSRHSWTGRKLLDATKQDL